MYFTDKAWFLFLLFWSAIFPTFASTSNNTVNGVKPCSFLCSNLTHAAVRSSMFVGHSQFHAMQLVCRRYEPQHHMPHQLLCRACGHLVLTSVLSQQPVLELLISVLAACWCIVVIIIIVWVVCFPLVGITNWIIIEMLFARIPVLVGMYMHYVCVCTLVSQLHVRVCRLLYCNCSSTFRSVRMEEWVRKFDTWCPTN